MGRELRRRAAEDCKRLDQSFTYPGDPVTLVGAIGQGNFGGHIQFAFTVGSLSGAAHNEPSGTVSIRGLDNTGNVVNTNNSYGALSDIKLKENIVDAHSQWADLKSLQVRNYNFKEGQTHTQLGLIAQEAELVSPAWSTNPLTAIKTAKTLALSPRASTTRCST
jgi:hypothetical protein